MKTSDWENRMESHPERTTLRLWLVALAIACVVGLAGWAAKTIFYPVEQAGKVMEKTLDADNVLYNYEYFKQAHQDILAIDQKIVIAKGALDSFTASAGPRENWDFRDKEEQQRLATNLSGVQNVRADMVATYNARSKMANRSIFKSSNLPEEIPLAIEAR